MAIKMKEKSVLEISEKGIFLVGKKGKRVKVKADLMAVQRSVAMKLAFNPDSSKGSTKLAGFEVLDQYHRASGKRHCTKTPFCINEDGHSGPCFDNLHELEIYPDEISRDGADWATMYITKFQEDHIGMVTEVKRTGRRK